MKKYTLDDFINEECATDPEFKQIWDEDEPEREFAISMIHAKKIKKYDTETTFKDDWYQPR